MPQPRLDKLITSLGADATFLQESDIDDQQIARLEQRYNLTLPQSYRHFLETYGLLHYGSITILGIGDASGTLSVGEALLVLRSERPDFPLNLVPIEYLGGGEAICITCLEPDDADANAPVFRVLLSNVITEDTIIRVAQSFDTYIIERLVGEREAQQWFERGVAQLKRRVHEFSSAHRYEHDRKLSRDGKLPRSHVWRPYRFCSQDVVLGTTVLCHVKGSNHLEIDVFLVEQHPDFQPDSGVEGLTLLLLCEAFRCGGTMELRFTPQVEGNRIPRVVQQLAMKCGVSLSETNIASGRLTPQDSRALFAALTHIPSSIINHIARRNLSVERICYVIAKGIWTQSEVEAILLSSDRPDRILAGGASPTLPVLRFHDLLVGRSALLAGFLERALVRGKPLPGSMDPEDDERELSVMFQSESHAKTYVCTPAPRDNGISFSIPWLMPHTGTIEIVPFGKPFMVLVRARDAAGLARHVTEDLALAARLRHPRERAFLLVPFDLYDPSLTGLLEHLTAQATREGVGVIVCPETVASLDEQVTQRLNASRIMRDE